MTSQLGITNPDHTHVLAPNLILRKVHQKSNPPISAGSRSRFQSSTGSSALFFNAAISSSSLSIGQKTFYGLARSKPLKRSNDLFEGLVLMIEGKGLLVCLFYVGRISGQ